MNMKKKLAHVKTKLILSLIFLLNLQAWSQTSPTVSITSPANNATFTAPANIILNATASVTGGATITQVEFFSGANSIGIDATSPYSIVWNNIPAGTYVITARATDSNGFRTNSLVVNITVNPSTGNQLPVVSITSPANSASFTAPASITINSTATDADGTIVQVDFYSGSTYLGSDPNSPYSFTWSNVAAGTYSLTAVATDNNGGVTTSAPISVTVNGGGNNVAPTVSITSPANGATFTAPASITINANAADADGTVSSVAFYNGTALLGTDATAPYSFVWTNVAAGTYGLTARATDNNGAVTVSAAISVTVNGAGNVLPTVSLTSPTNGATFTAPASITINATAADADGTISSVAFYNGSTLLGSDATSPYSFAWTNVAAGTYTLTAKATDNSGAVTTSAAISVTVNGAGNVAPTVSITLPANNATFTAPASITINANAADADGTVSSVAFYNGSTLLGTDATSAYSFTWTNVAAGTYTLTAKATDNSGAVTTSSAITVVVNPATTTTGVTIQAETACTVDGAFNETANAGYTGTGYVNTDDVLGASATWAVNSQTAQAVSLDIRYAHNTATGRPMSLSVNGTVQVANIPFPATGSPSTWVTTTVQISLAAGANTIKMVSLAAIGSPYIDAFTYGSTTVSAGTCSTSANIPPTVSITSPVNGAAFAEPASITINATAADADGTVSSVAFYNGTTLLGTSATAPYSFVWTNVAAGSYTLTAKATDNNGAVTASSAISIVVNPVTTSTVTIQGETACTVDGTLNETANAGFHGTGYLNTNNFLGASATWSVNSQTAQTINLAIRYATATTTGRPMSLSVNGIMEVANIPFPYTGGVSTWVVTNIQINLAAGANTIKMVALNAIGSPYLDEFTYGSATVSQGTCNISPTVSITAPVNNATYTAPANITINATAADADGSVASVAFYNGTTLIGTDVTSPYSFVWANVPAGTYTLTAIATDNNGATTTSGGINVLVNPAANIPPTIAITSPVNNSTYTAPASITITATAADADGTIISVAFYEGSILLGTDATAPYSFSWTNVAAGTNTITARATDNNGAVTISAPIIITVNPSVNIAPTVSITAPLNNTVYTAPASITINATAADADGTISSVGFYNGTTLLSTDATSPYSFTWTNVAAGTYSLTAKATDNSGAVTTSAPVTVTVNPSVNIAPTVSITAPLNNAVYTAPASITINATAADADGTISSVGFYNGTTLIGTDATSPYSFTWTNVTAGTYTLTATATDNSGAVTTSTPVTVTVNPAATTVTIQAEHACKVDGVLNETTNSGYTGTGYVNTDDVLNASATWAINSQVAQTVSLDIRYAHNTAAGRPMALKVNGIIQVPNIAFASTGSGTTWVNTSVQVSLTTGLNSLQLVSLSSAGSPYIDALTFGATNITEGTCSTVDCNGVVGGTAVKDNCGSCVGGTTGQTACTLFIIEAETACSVDGALNESANAGFKGTGYVNTIDVIGASVSYVINATTAQTVNLIIRYAHNTAAGRPMSLKVNGILQVANIPFPSTGSPTTWLTTSVPVNVDAGTNNFEFESLTSIGSPYIDEIGFTTATVTAGNCNQNKTIQAELACSVDGALNESANSGFTGTGYVNTYDSLNAGATWYINSVSSGSVSLGIRYANNSATGRTMSLNINGVNQGGNIAFQSTGGSTSWVTTYMNVNLVAGINTIRLISLTSMGSPYMDALTFGSPDISLGTCPGTNTGNGNCNIIAVPTASQWSIGNDWADQNSGANVSNTTDAMKITQRQWGLNKLWIMETGKPMIIESGKIYTIQFDFQNDLSTPVNSIDVGFATQANWNGPSLALPAVNVSVSSGSAYQTRTATITSNVNATVFLSFGLNWSAQLTAQGITYLKNISVCSASPALLANAAAASQSSVGPNPSSGSFTLTALESIQTFSVINDQGTVVYTGSSLAATESAIFGAQLQSGLYVMLIQYADGTIETRKILKTL
jgi:hypothetical protein